MALMKISTTSKLLLHKSSITFEQTLMHETKSVCDRYRKQFIQSSGAISEGIALVIAVSSGGALAAISTPQL